jgi:hypothetical protein
MGKCGTSSTSSIIHRVYFFPFFFLTLFSLGRVYQMCGFLTVHEVLRTFSTVGIGSSRSDSDGRSVRLELRSESLCW